MPDFDPTIFTSSDLVFLRYFLENSQNFYIPVRKENPDVTITLYAFDIFALVSVQNTVQNAGNFFDVFIFSLSYRLQRALRNASEINQNDLKWLTYHAGSSS